MLNKVRSVLKVKVDAQHTCINMYTYVCTCTYIYINVEGLSSESVLHCVKKIRVGAQPVKGCPPDQCRSVCLLSVTGRSAYALRSYQSLFSHWI